MLIHPFRTAEYLQGLAHYPLAVLVDSEGQEWTWAEGRALAIAVRGVLPGVPPGASRWADTAGWPRTPKLVFASPRAQFSTLYNREALLGWTGTPWLQPEDPCHHCGGTGRRHGTAAGQQRIGRLRQRIVLDRNLLAQLIQAFEPGALIIDAGNRQQDARDPVRLRSVDGDTRAVLARSVGAPPDEPTFELARQALSDTLPLSGYGSGVDPGLELPKTPVSPAPPAPLAPARARRPSSLLVHRSRVCNRCGGVKAGGVCGDCGDRG